MNCGDVFQSMEAWQKFSGIRMKPKVAYKVLKYAKLVLAEREIIESQRVALIHEITNTEAGSEVKIEPGTNEFKAYVNGMNEVLSVESSIKPLDLDFSEVIDALDEKDESVTVSDLSALEPFFCCPDDNCDCECKPDDGR